MKNRSPEGAKHTQKYQSFNMTTSGYLSPPESKGLASHLACPTHSLNLYSSSNTELIIKRC